MYEDIIQGAFRFSYQDGIIVVYDSNSRLHSYFRNCKVKNKEHFKNMCHYLYLKKMKKIL